jgi:hypothetical protein
VDGDEEDPCNDEPDNNFMNGAAAKQGPNVDDDGANAEGNYVTTTTAKMLRRQQQVDTAGAPSIVSFPESLDDFGHGLDMVAGETADKAIAASDEDVVVVTPDVDANGDKLPVITVKDFELGITHDFSDFASPLPSPSPSPTVSPSMAVNDASRRELYEELEKDEADGEKKRFRPLLDSDGDPVMNPEARQPGAPTGINVAISENGSFNPISLDKATTAAGVPGDADPLGGTQTRGPSKARAYPLPTINERNPDDMNQVSYGEVDREGGVGENYGSAASLLQVDQISATSSVPTISFAPVAVPAAGVTVEVDPLAEFRKAAATADDDDDDLDSGCVSTEDGYTGNSQPRIDYLGNNQVIHIQPMMGKYTIYNVSSRMAVRTGDLPVPFKPIRRTFLGGKDNRLLEHYPLTGIFRFYKCPLVAYETCSLYAEGQWDATVDTDDVFVPLAENRVMAVNQNTGKWRIFAFDRDVGGASDPFSTAIHPVANGQFPDFANDEVMSMGLGKLLIHTPMTGAVRVFEYDEPALAAPAALRNVVIRGPTFVGSMPESGHRLTSLGDGRVLELFVRRQTAQVYQCGMDADASTTPVCVMMSSLYLYQSTAFERNPTISQLLSLDRVMSLPAWSTTSASISYVRRGSIVSVSASEMERRDLLPGQVMPVTEFPIAPPAGIMMPYVHKILLRPGVDTEYAALVQIKGDGLAGSDVTKQIMLVRAGESVLVDAKVDSDHALGAFSSDGKYLSYTAADSGYTLAIVDVASVWEGSPKVVLTAGFPGVSNVVAGAFSTDNRYAVASADGKLYRLDTVSGLVDPVDLGEGRVAYIARGATFHPFLYKVFAMTGPVGEPCSLDLIDIVSGLSSPALSFAGGAVVGASFDSAFTRCAVTVEVDGYTEYHVYSFDKRQSTFDEIAGPFLPLVKSLVGSDTESAMMISPSGDALAVSKETLEEPAQIFIGRFGERPVVKPPSPAELLDLKTGRIAANRTRPAKSLNITDRSPGLDQPQEPPPVMVPVVSSLERLTQGRVEIPADVTNLPLMKTVTISETTKAYYFAPDLKPLLKNPPPTPLPPPITRGNNATRPKPPVPVPIPPLSNMSFATFIPHVIYLPSGAKHPSMWTSTVRAALSYVRTKGVGVLVPFPAAAGSLTSHQDVARARNYLCREVPYSNCRNIALVGENTGAYLALMAEANAPKGTFSAVVDVAGVTDVPSHLETLKPQAARPAQEALFAGSGSPLSMVKQISAPLMVLHGQADEAVSPVQSEKLVSAVRANAGIVKFMSLHDVRHSLTHALSTENKLLAASSMSEFLLAQMRLTKDDEIMN